mgnify:FL=1
MAELRRLMFANVYKNPKAKTEEMKAKEMLKKLYAYYVEHPEKMSEEYLALIRKGERLDRVVCDYISGMTDQYSMNRFRELFIPKSWGIY